MSNGKGKGLQKAADKPEEREYTAETTTSSFTSVLDKVSASATGLSRSVFGAPNSIELNESATTALATSGKGQGQPSGSSQSSVWVESSQTSQQQPSQVSQQPPPKTFRNSHQEQHSTSAELQFSTFLDGVDSFVSFIDESTKPVSNNEGTSSIESTSWAHNSHYNSEEGKFRTFQEQELHDGEAVLDILSDRRRVTDSFPPQNIEDEIEEWRFTDEQSAKLQALAKELFSSQEIHTDTDTTGPLNLQPDSFRSKDMSIWLPDEYSQDSYSHFGQVLPQEEANRLWIGQWDDVLTRYTDEVWGGLLPLVKEAREEIMTLKQATDVSDDHRPKALRRLGQVLAHFKV